MGVYMESVKNNQTIDNIAAAQNVQDYEKVAMRVSKVSIAANFVLMIFKLLAGVVAHSGAMVSDAIHSASDVFSTIVVIIDILIPIITTIVLNISDAE